MESYNELQHWGIKGQKWGIRRYQNPDGSYTEEGIRRYQKKYPYQNPDGSLTEAGKTNYMKAARKNQLDYKNLSDKDLDMINNRFNKENLYKRNIENYEKSTFKYKAKEALISRIKGNNGGGDSGKKKGKGGGGKGNGILAKLLLSPIEQAFKDALKSDNKDGDKEEEKEKNKKEKNDTNEEYAPRLRNLLSSGRHFALTGYSEDSSERLESRRKNGQRFVEEAVNRTSEEILRERSRNNAIARKNDSWWQNRMDNPDSWGWSGMAFDTSNYLSHSGLYVISRSDELYHHGTKGQKWGVRRYQNPDGTLTEEGRKHYGVAEGGSRSMSRKFNREMKKLNKLSTRTDVDVQQQKAAQYDKRVKTGLKVAGAGAAIAGVGAAAEYGGKSLRSQLVSNALRVSRDKEWGAKQINDEQYFDDWTFWDNQRRKLDGTELGDWNKIYDVRQKQAYDTHKRNDEALTINGYLERGEIKDKARRASQIHKGVMAAGVATAVVGGGIAAYNKIQSHLAKKRVTELGHNEAVKKAEAQVERMQKMFGNTPYADLVKDLEKNIKHAEE